jgi:hypothetical protein
MRKLPDEKGQPIEMLEKSKLYFNSSEKSQRGQNNLFTLGELKFEPYFHLGFLNQLDGLFGFWAIRLLLMSRKLFRRVAIPLVLQFDEFLSILQNQRTSIESYFHKSMLCIS